VSFDTKLDQVLARYHELGDILATGNHENGQEFARLSKEYSDLRDVAEAITSLRKEQAEVKDLEELLQDPTLDAEFKALAEEDLRTRKEQIPTHEHTIKVLLLPKDADDERNVILEIRGGAGGDEAALFASNLLRMYQRYAEGLRWRFEIISLTDTGIGGIKEVTASVMGKGVYSRLKFESGVHRVQRVPATESQGRIHTSTATVAVLPEVEEVDKEEEEEEEE